MAYDKDEVSSLYNLLEDDPCLLYEGDSAEGFKVVDKEYKGRSRWSIIYLVVIESQNTGNLYGFEIEEAATEMQEDFYPWEYSSDPTQIFFEVEPVEVTQVEYRRVAR